MARLIGGLPKVRAAFGAGELCFSQVRAITRVATPENEAELVQIARHATAGQLETIVRAFRGVLELELGAAQRAHRRRYVRCEHDDDGSLLIHARLPAEEGALVLAALAAGRDALRDGSAAGSPVAAHQSAAADPTSLPAGDRVAAANTGSEHRDERVGAVDPSAEIAAAGIGPVVGVSASAEATHTGDSAAGSSELAAAVRAEPTVVGAVEFFPVGSASAEATHIGDTDTWDPGAWDGVGDDPAAEGVDEDAWTPDPTPVERGGVSNADALVVLMAQTKLAAGPAARSGADGYELVVHVDAATLADDADGGCGLDGGPALNPETARRLGCDAGVVRILERDGRPLSVGRRTRSVSPALRRALESRDRGCRFPGCERRRFLHAHHIRHWARGGRTDLSNMLQLCGFHHRLVHEGGYTIEPRTRGKVLFRRPDGRAVAPVPHRPPGDRHQLQRRNRRAGLTLNDSTCVPQTDFQRADIAWIVDGLAETDRRLGA